MKVRTYLLDNDSIVVRPEPDTEPPPARVAIWVLYDSGIIQDWKTTLTLATIHIRGQYVVHNGHATHIEKHRSCGHPAYKVREEYFDPVTKEAHVCPEKKRRGRK